MSKICWYCKQEIGWENDAELERHCNNCGVLNDRNPYPPEIKKEEEMINYSDEKYQGKFVYLPLMGETAVFDIAEISEVKSDNPKFNFSEKVPVLINGEPAMDDEGEALYKQKDLGYHIEAKLKNGKVLSVTSISAFIQVFKKHNIQDGDNVKIFHKDKGEWEVIKL